MFLLALMAVGLSRSLVDATVSPIAPAVTDSRRDIVFSRAHGTACAPAGCFGRRGAEGNAKRVSQLDGSKW